MIKMVWVLLEKGLGYDFVVESSAGLFRLEIISRSICTFNLVWHKTTMNYSHCCPQLFFILLLSEIR